MMKREEVVNVFRGKFELLALTETKLKGNREVSWCEINGTWPVFRRQSGREGVAILLNNVWD